MVVIRQPGIPSTMQQAADQIELTDHLDAPALKGECLREISQRDR
ncbi:hypothetical protein [Synechococcus sp. MIT S9501]